MRFCPIGFTVLLLNYRKIPSNARKLSCVDYRGMGGGGKGARQMSTKASCEVLGSLEFIPESWPLVIFLLTVCYASCILVWLINVCAHVCTLGGPIDNRGRCVIYYHMISASSSLFPVPLSFTSAYIINCAHMLALLSLESRVLIIGQHVLAHDPVDTFSGTWTLKCQLDLHPRPECPGVWIFQTFTSIP